MFSPHSSPQSLLYKKYIEDFTKSGEIHLTAIELSEYECDSINGKNCTSRCVFIYSMIMSREKYIVYNK